MEDRQDAALLSHAPCLRIGALVAARGRKKQICLLAVAQSTDTIIDRRRKLFPVFHNEQPK